MTEKEKKIENELTRVLYGIDFIDGWGNMHLGTTGEYAPDTREEKVKNNNFLYKNFLDVEVLLNYMEDVKHYSDKHEVYPVRIWYPVTEEEFLKYGKLGFSNVQTEYGRLYREIYSDAEESDYA